MVSCADIYNMSTATIAPARTSYKEALSGLRRHLLLDAPARKKLPGLNSTRADGEQALAVVKFFWSGSIHFYVTEFDGLDTVYGLLTNGAEKKWQTFSMKELCLRTYGPWRTPLIERDRPFKAKTVEQALANPNA